MGFTAPASQLTEEQVAFLTTIDSPTIANAVEVFKLRDRTDGFLGGATRALFPDLGVMVGQALTVTVGNRPGDSAARDGYWQMWEALEQMPKPAVLVMQDVSGQPSRCAYAGEVMATLAQRLGAVGMVTDGGYRDVNEVRALGMHYYAAYHVVSHGNFSIEEVGVPIELDGQRIETGDVLHGDVNGIVIIPAAAVAGIQDEVAKIREREKRVMDFIKGDTFSLQGVKEGRGY